MKKATILVMFISILAKVLGFARDLFLSSFFGIGAITDAFNLAVSIPNSVFSLIGAALVTGLIPMITRLDAEDKNRTNRFVNNVLNIMMLFALVMSFLIFLVPEAAVFVFAANLGPEALQYAIPFVRIVSLGMICIAIVQLGSGFLNVKKNFLIPAAITIPANIIVVLSIILSASLRNSWPYAPYILAFGQLLALFVQAFIIIFFMYRSGFRYRFLVDFSDKDLRIMVTLALPLLLSSIIGQFNDIVMKNMATMLHTGNTGGYSYMTYVTKLIGFVSGIFITAILNVTYPTIASNVVAHDKKRLHKSINDALLLIFVFVVPALVGFLMIPNEIVSFVFLRGKVTVDDINVIVPIFMFESLVLLPMACRELMFRIHYAYHDMKTPVKNTIFVSVMFVIGMVIFSYIFGKFGHPLAGLSFAYSLAALIACFPLYFSMKKHVGAMHFGGIKKDFFKIIVSAVVMALLIFGLKIGLQAVLGNRNITTILIIGLAACGYLVSLVALRTNFVLVLIYDMIYKKK